MTAFAINKPVATSEPVVTVDAGLPVGGHRFALQVQRGDGRASTRSVVIVQVVRPLSPERITPLDRLRPREPIQPTDRISPVRPTTPIAPTRPVRPIRRRPGSDPTE